MKVMGWPALAGCVILLDLLVPACAGESAVSGTGDSAAESGGKGSGGASHTGGMSGGTPAPASGGGNGNSNSSGNSSGSKGSGGASGTGGAIGSGGAGNTSSGHPGGMGSGGLPSTGGSGTTVTATGGAVATGGVGATGGTPGTGGAATATFRCPAGPFSAPAFAGAVPTRVAAVPPSDSFNNNRNNFGVIEGPVWVGNALYVSEIATPDNVNPPLSRLLKVDAAGGVSIVLSNSGTNGMAVDSAGNLVAGNHKDGAVTRFALPSLATTAVVSTFGGARFDSPNDLTFRSDGSLYFTDPDWQASLVRPQTKTRIYRVAPGATTATVLDETRLEPNGITFSPDGNTLYVTGADGLFRYNVAADGSIGTGTKILPSIGVGDGMAIDCAGNLYVAANASNTLVVVDPAGNMLGTITIANVMGVTNAAFGGADHKTLYITTLGTGSQFGLFSLAMNVPGFPY